MKINIKKFSYFLASVALSFGVAMTVSNIMVKTAPVKAETVNQVKYVTWDQAMKSDKPIAIDFYAEWCGYCKRFAPVLDKLNTQYSDKYSFVKINAEASQNRKIVDDFGISSYPSFYLYDPKTNKKVFVNQNNYTNTKLLTEEMDNFLKNCK